MNTTKPCCHNPQILTQTYNAGARRTVSKTCINCGLTNFDHEGQTPQAKPSADKPDIAARLDELDLANMSPDQVISELMGIARGLLKERDNDRLRHFLEGYRARMILTGDA